MELATIKGDTALLVYHPAEGEAAVGDQFALLEMPGGAEGLVVQVVGNELVDHEGLMQGVYQRLLEARLSESEIVLDRERGMGELAMLKAARAKIRKRVVGGAWKEWDGYVPARNVRIKRVAPEELLGRILPRPARVPLPPFARHGETPITFDGPRLGHVSVVTGRKGTGKSHLAKHLVLTLARLRVPVIVYDFNNEYARLPDAQALRWRDNFHLSLSESGHAVLRTVVSALAPFQPGSPSEAAFEARLPVLFRERREACAGRGTGFSLDIAYLQRQNWSDNSYVSAAIQERLEMIDEMGLFAREVPDAPAGARRSSPEPSPEEPPRFADLYAAACSGRPLIFERAETSPRLFGVLVRGINQLLERLCRPDGDGQAGAGDPSPADSRTDLPLPYTVYDEAHLYLQEDALLNLLSRVRHVGISAIFVSNTPRRLPGEVFRQADNVFVLPTRHEDDLRAVCEVALADADTVRLLAQRLPPRHALVLGALTDGYPLVVSICPLPDGVPLTGASRSAWDRFPRAAE